MHIVFVCSREAKMLARGHESLRQVRLAMQSRILCCRRFAPSVYAICSRFKTMRQCIVVDFTFRRPCLMLQLGVPLSSLLFSLRSFASFASCCVRTGRAIVTVITSYAKFFPLRYSHAVGKPIDWHASFRPRMMAAVVRAGAGGNVLERPGTAPDITKR